MSLTRRSLFGVLASAVAALGLAKVAVPAEAKGFRLGSGAPVPVFNSGGRFGKPWNGSDGIYDPRQRMAAVSAPLDGAFREAMSYMRVPGTRALLLVSPLWIPTRQPFGYAQLFLEPGKLARAWSPRERRLTIIHSDGPDSQIVFDEIGPDMPFDSFRHAGAEYHYIGWNEYVTPSMEARAYLRTRLRRLKGGPAVALRMYGDPVGA